MSCEAHVELEAHPLALLPTLLTDELGLCAGFGTDWKGPLLRVEGKV